MEKIKQKKNKTISLWINKKLKFYLKAKKGCGFIGQISEVMIQRYLNFSILI